MALIELKKISKIYGEGDAQVTALSDTSFNIDEGEFVSIMGPSGSGKSTLMHIMGLLDRPSAGQYQFEGTNVADFSDDELARIRNEHMGFVFQAFNLLPKTTVLDNIKLPMVYAGVSDKVAEQMARKAVETVNLGPRIKHYSNQLSGGEKQRVAIARALVNNPLVIFADEPTGNLDSRSGAAIMALLQELNDKGHVIILVTHELSAARWGKRLITIRDGKIESDSLIAERNSIHGENNLLK